MENDAMTTCLDQTGIEIVQELQQVARALGAQSDLLSIVGSWGDTLDDADILKKLKSWNEKHRDSE